MSFINNKILYEALTFDDVLLVPAFSDVLPNNVSIKTRLTKKIHLGIPVISSPMDTVTEYKMAIAMAKVGGIGIIHKNLSSSEIASQIKKVKQYTDFIVYNPVTVLADTLVSDAVHLMSENNYSGVPVIDKLGTLVGILTNRDLRLHKAENLLVKNIMKSTNLITVREGVTNDEALNIMHQNRIERLIVVGENFECIGLITMSDIQRINNLDDLISIDSKGRLMVGAAIGVNNEEYIDVILAQEPDVLVLDTAHGHSKGVIDAVRKIKNKYPHIQVIAGNIATPEAALALIEAGADAIKIGIGPGSICTTRIVTGVGVPQLSAIMNIAALANKHDIPLIADGGIKYSGDIAKAIAAGADCVMIGSLLASCEESPGDMIIFEGKKYKLYRGMGSSGAMSRGSADRYSQSHLLGSTSKFVPEGVEGMVIMRDSVREVIYNLCGGLRSSMGYTGNKTIEEMKNNTKMVKITGAGLKESHVNHSVLITKEASNYC